MSRYKEIIRGEKELGDINGVNFLIYPTIETKAEFLEIIRNSQLYEEIDIQDEKGKVVGTKRVRGTKLNLNEIANLCTKMVYEGCFYHDKDGKRIKKKEEEKDTTPEQIKENILNCGVLAVYFKISTSLDFLTNEKANEMQEGAEEAAKKELS